MIYICNEFNDYLIDIDKTMKKIILSVGLCCALQGSFAQDIAVTDSIQPQTATDSIMSQQASPQEEISVTRFKRLANDLTARVTAPKRDQNNEPCAIIKVVTKDKGLFFEPDALGITAREDQPGEIWLYVPHGAKRITIKHERFGIIRNYFYGEPIDKATVYELILHVPEVKGEKIIVRQEVTEQALMMNYAPSQAQIFIDDVLQKTNGNGAFTAVLPLGQHNYRVVAPHYTEEKGSFDIVPERPTALNASLPPVFGFMTVASNMDKTDVTVNGNHVGELPYASDTIAIGTYKVNAKRKWYLPQEKDVEVRPTETSVVEFNLLRQKPNIFLMAQLGNAMDLNKQTSFGLMAGICRKGGAYVSVRTNGSPAFDWKDVSNDGGVYSGNIKKHHMSLSAGFMARFFANLYMYGGGGYLWRNLDWETGTAATPGEYQTVVNNNGPMVELGLIGRYKCFALSVGAAVGFGTDTYAETALEANDGYLEFTVGIGYVFGR